MLGYDALTPRLLVLVFGSLVAAALAHEWTHILVAKALGADVRIVERDFGVIPTMIEWEIPASKPRACDYLINLAPFLGATSIAAGYYLVFGLPAVTLESGMAAVALVVYGQISPDDVTGLYATTFLSVDLETSEQLLAITVGLFGGGFYLYQGAVLWLPDRFDVAVASIGISLVFASLGVFVMSLEEYRRENEIPIRRGGTP